MDTHGFVLAIVVLLGCALAVPQTFNDQNYYNSPINVRRRSWLVNKYPHAVIYSGHCGGTIISPEWILTAAHCTLLTTARTVLAGPYNPDGGVSRTIKRRVIHPLFSIGPYWHSPREFNTTQIVTHWDFMLVELDQPLPLDGITMKAAVLAERNGLTAGMEVSYAGFGTIQRGGQTISRRFKLGEMHEMKLALEPNSVCARIEQFEAKDLFCAKAVSPIDVICPLQGDSGSGLINQEGSLIGVASWVEDDARNCINANLVFFSRVGAVRRWIKNVTNI